MCRGFPLVIFWAIALLRDEVLELTTDVFRVKDSVDFVLTVIPFIRDFTN